MTRVVHLYDGHEQVHDGRGSVPGVVWNLARATAAADHDVTVVERQWTGLPKRATHEDVRFRRLDLPTGADEPWTRVPYEQVTAPLGLLRLIGDRTAFAVAGLRALRRLDPDIVHVHLPFAASVLVTVAPWLRDRMVYTAHLGDLRLNLLDADQADDDIDVPGVLELVSPDVYLAKRVAHTTVLNPSIRDAFVEHGVDASTLSVVPNGVDVDRFASPDDDTVRTVRERYAPDGRPLVLFVGTVMPRKGVLDLIDAFAQVVTDATEPPRLVVAGDTDLDGAYVDSVRTRIDEAGLSAAVDLAGFVDADLLPALYSVADVLVVPSLEEGFGMTAVEALAAGTPVVGTRVGGLPDAIDDGVTGRLVDPGDVDALANAIARWLDDANPATPERCRTTARTFSWSGVADQVDDVYGEVAA